jgi:hypothetical protein
MKLAVVMLVAACGAPQRTAQLECGDLHCSTREICVTTDLSWAIREHYPTIPQYECRAEPRAVYVHGLGTVDAGPMLSMECRMRDARHEDCSVEEERLGPDNFCMEHGHSIPC